MSKDVMNNNSNNEDKSREQIIAEREAARKAKKDAKAAKAAGRSDEQKKVVVVAASAGAEKSSQSGNTNVATTSTKQLKNTVAPSTSQAATTTTSKPPKSQTNLPIPARSGGTHDSTYAVSQSNMQQQSRSGRTKSSITSSSSTHFLFGNVTVAKTASEIRQQIVSATFRSIIHPSILKVAQHLATFAIVGADARAIAVLKALRDFIVDYATPKGAVLNRDLVARLAPQINFLVQARPLGTSVGHAIRYLKYEISITPVDYDEHEAKDHIVSRIDHFVRDRITYATRVIATTLATTKIRQNDVILTFGKSSVVEKTLLEAQERGTTFHVIVIDARPLCEGKNMLTNLANAGIPCTYGQLTSLGTLIARATMVLLGTASLLANGALYARAGTAACAMMAKRVGTPVIVCCETYKFSERVQLDGFVVNEAVNAEMLLRKYKNEEDGGGEGGEDETDHEDVGPLSNMLSLKEWNQQQLQDASTTTTTTNNNTTSSSSSSSSSLGIVNLLYDLTPPQYINAVASEVGLSGPESVGVILRDYKSVLYGQ